MKYLDNECLSFIQSTPATIIELLPLTTFNEFSYNDIVGAYFYGGEPSYNFEIGTMYEINWDGKVYNCIAQDLSEFIEGTIGLGFTAPWGQPSNGDEPFVIGYVPAYDQILYCSVSDREVTPHTVGVKKIIAKASQVIDNEYYDFMEPFDDTSVIVPTKLTQFQFDEGEGCYVANIDEKLFALLRNLKVANIYDITFENKVYQCQTIDASSLLSDLAETLIIDKAIMFGNPILFSDSGLPPSQNNEPFFGLVVNLIDTAHPTDRARIAAILTDKTVDRGDLFINFGISTIGTSKYKIKEKYLPERDINWNEIIDRPLQDRVLIYQRKGTMPLALNYQHFYMDCISGEDINKINLQVGKKYIVVWNNIEYICICVEEDNYLLLGNTSYIDDISETNNGMPFSIRLASGNFFDFTDEELESLPLYIEGQPTLILSNANTNTADYDFIIYEADEQLDNKKCSFFNYYLDKQILLDTVLENFTLNDEFGLYNLVDQTNGYNLIIGETYLVNWDDTQYECVAIDGSSFIPGAVAIGNGSLMGLSGNDEPFIIGTVNGYDNYLSLKDSTPCQHQVKIERVFRPSEEYILQTQYLPDIKKIPILKEQDYEFEWEEDFEGYIGQIEYTNNISINTNSSYLIKLDGNSYEVKAYIVEDNEEDLVTFGNSEFINEVTGLTLEPNDLPFVVTIASNSIVIFLLKNPVRYHTFGIYELVKPVPEVTQQDEGKVLTVKNGRTIWADAPASAVSVPEITTIFAETTVEGFVHDSTYNVFTPNWVSPAQFTLIEGQTYYVEWDGQTYECIAFQGNVGGNDLVFIGNGTSFGMSGNEEPFSFSYNEQYNNSQIFAATEENSHLIKIYQKNSSTTVSGGGLPDVTTSDNGKILQVVNGEWVAISIEESSIKTYLDEYIRSVLESDY